MAYRDYSGEEIVVKEPIQFRAGRRLRERIDEAVEKSGLSKNQWLTEAFEHRLENGNGKATRVSADELLTDKRPVFVRLDPLVVELIDEEAADHGQTRTVWMLDAVLVFLHVKR